MLRFGKIIIGLVLIGSLTLVLSYCSSSSSDSGTASNGTASAGAGASASTGAIMSATMGLSATTAGSAGSSSTGASSLSKARNLSEAINGMYSGLRAKRANANTLKAKFMAAAAPYSAQSITTMPCASGTMTMDIVTPDIVTAITDTTMTITYDNCTENINNVLQVQNGTLVFVDSDSSFTFSLGNSTTPYTNKITRLSDNVVLQDEVTTMTFSGALSNLVSCGTGTEYSNLTIDMDGNLHSKGIDDAGVPYDNIAAFTAYKLVANSNLDTSCTATGGTIDESGKLAYTDNLDSKGNASMDMSAANPLNLTWRSDGTLGDYYQVGGTVSMVTPCFTGSLTLQTTTEIYLPTNGDCPTAGEVVVSGSVNGSVVYTSTGGVEVRDGTGVLVETHASCDEAQACI